MFKVQVVLLDGRLILNTPTLCAWHREIEYWPVFWDHLPFSVMVYRPTSFTKIFLD